MEGTECNQRVVKIHEDAEKLYNLLVTGIKGRLGILTGETR